MIQNMRNQCLFIFLILVLCRIDGNASEREQYKVVIIGAGISGLGAATKLLKNNVTDILILEASNRIGGRVYTAPFGDFLIEYGAQWVHGQEGNAVFEIAQSYNLFDIQDFDGIPNFFINFASKVNKTLVNTISEDVFSLFDDSTALESCNCSLESYFETRFRKFKEKYNVDEYTEQAVKDIVQKFEGTSEGTNNLSIISTWGIGQFGVTNGSLSTAWKSGYHSFIDMLLGKYEGNELPVLNKTKFGKVVQRVDWTGDIVEILCEDGSHYFADHVISTVSLGVLKHSAKTMFTPQLPERKLSAIESIGIDVVNKIFIQFETRWWPLEFDWDITFLWSDEDKERFLNSSKHGDWTTEVSGFHYVENQPRVLEGWITGQAARRLEELSDKEVTDGVIDLLHWFVDGKFSISRPINITRSAWASNRFTRGSYSFATIESDHHGYFAADIAQPLAHNNSNPVLLFAGEATHDYFRSTVHGALESGWREANRILNFQ